MNQFAMNVLVALTGTLVSVAAPLPLQRGKVKRVRSDEYMFIAPDGGGRDVYASIGNGRQVHAGAEGPEFVEDYPGSDPVDGERVIFQTVDSGMRCAPKKFNAVVWAYEVDWDAAVAKIESRPVYRVTQTAYYNDQPVSENPTEVVAEGTAWQIRRDHPRDFEATCVAFTYRYVVEMATGDRWERVTNEAVLKSLGVPTPPKIQLVGVRGRPELKDFGELSAVAIG